MSLYINPALIGQMSTNEFSCYYSPAPFGLAELKTAAAAAGFSINNSRFAAAVTTYGFSLYNRVTASAAYSLPVSEKSSVGVSLNSVTITIKNYGSATAIYPNFGFIYNISDEIAWGTAIQNLTNTKIGKSKAQLPVLYATGFCFTAERLQVFVTMEKENAVPVSLRAGSSYSATDNFELLVGYNGAPVQLSGGIAISISPVGFTYALTDNQILGYTHQIGLSCRF